MKTDAMGLSVGSGVGQAQAERLMNPKKKASVCISHPKAGSWRVPLLLLTLCAHAEEKGEPLPWLLVTV